MATNRMMNKGMLNKIKRKVERAKPRMINLNKARIVRMLLSKKMGKVTRLSNQYGGGVRLVGRVKYILVSLHKASKVRVLLSTKGSRCHINQYGHG